MKELTIEQIKIAYPNEWVLLGNPKMDDTNLSVLSGLPLLHSKDKKEVCYIGRDKTVGYQSITLIYTGQLRQMRRLTGVFNRVNQ